MAPSVKVKNSVSFNKLVHFYKCILMHKKALLSKKKGGDLPLCLAFRFWPRTQSRRLGLGIAHSRIRGSVLISSHAPSLVPALNPAPGLNVARAAPFVFGPPLRPRPRVLFPPLTPPWIRHCLSHASRAWSQSPPQSSVQSSDTVLVWLPGPATSPQEESRNSASYRKLRPPPYTHPLSPPLLRAPTGRVPEFL